MAFAVGLITAIMICKTRIYWTILLSVWILAVLVVWQTTEEYESQISREVALYEAIIPKTMEVTSFVSNLSSNEKSQRILGVMGGTPNELQRIAECESGNRHFDENGQVIRGKINPLDIGRYQINLFYHGEQSARLGLDLFDEQDNETYALWLYAREGSWPWRASGFCWLDKKSVLP